MDNTTNSYDSAYNDRTVTDVISTSTDYFDYPTEDYGKCDYEQHGASFLPALYSLFFVLGLVGNSLVIWVITCRVRLRSMTDVCILNLAVADLLLVCTLPFLAHQAWDHWVFGDATCKVVLGIYHIVFYSGIFFICLMSIDRYLAIVHAFYAMKARTRLIGTIAAAVIWISAFFASFPDLIFLKQQDASGLLYCFPEYPNDNVSSSNNLRIISLLKMNILGLLIPITILTFCYSGIIWKLLHGQSSRKKAIHLVLTAVCFFFCCWCPFNVASFFKALELMHVYKSCESSKAINLALWVTEVIAYSHSCVNPILYVFVGEKFRKHLLTLIHRSPCRLCQIIKVYIPQDRNSASVYSQTTSVDERSTAV